MPVQPSLFEPPSDQAPSTATVSAARLCALVEELIHLNAELPVIVEGARDINALRRLGLGGTILQLHNGQTVAAFGERMSRAFPAVILLLDWDRRGRQLHRQLTRHLDCDWEAYNYVRQELMMLCTRAISTVEELPAWLALQAPHRPPPRTAP
jgi:5S rRNA maturation endonuclease (ribonuclease M5)